MDITGFFLRVVLVAFPGILASLIYGKLKGKGSRKDWEDFMEILVFSVMSYGLYDGVLYALGWFGLNMRMVFFDALFNSGTPISLCEITWASLIGVLLAFLASAAYTRGLLFRVGRTLRVTDRWSDGDVWAFFHSSEAGETWLYVRDHKLNRLYFGWIHGYSESEKERELWLKDVRVYDNTTGEELYELKDIMFSRERDALTIETQAAHKDTKT